MQAPPSRLPVLAMDANTEALPSATGKYREQLLTERARQAAERYALPGMLEILTRRYAEAVIAACHYVHHQAVQVNNDADDVIATRSTEPTRMLDALTLLECSSLDHEKAETKRAELRELDQLLQLYHRRREEARVVISYLELTLHQLLGDGRGTAHVRPESIERYVQRSTRKVA